MTDIESLIAELQTEGWHYQRVRHLAMRALHLAEDELADVHSRGELTERLLVLVLTKASQAPAPAAERTAAPVLKLAPPAPAPEPEPAPLLDPDAEILVVIDGAWVFGFAPAGETDKVEALKVGAQALAPGRDIKLVPHVGAWPPYLKAWSERPGKTRALDSSPRADLARHLDPNSIPVDVGRRPPGFVATSGELPGREFLGVTPNDARSKCARAVIAHLRSSA